MRIRIFTPPVLIVLLLSACGGDVADTAATSTAQDAHQRIPEVVLDVHYAIGGSHPVNGNVPDTTRIYTDRHYLFQADSCAAYARGGPVQPARMLFLLPRAEGLGAHLQVAIRDYAGPGRYEGKGKLTSPIPGDGKGVWIGSAVFAPTMGADAPKTESTVVVNADGSGSWEFRNLFREGSHDPIEYLDGSVSWTCRES